MALLGMAAMTERPGFGLWCFAGREPAEMQVAPTRLNTDRSAPFTASEPRPPATPLSRGRRQLSNVLSGAQEKPPPQLACARSGAACSVTSSAEPHMPSAPQPAGQICLTCPICLEAPFLDPVTSSCGHSFDLACFNQLRLRASCGQAQHLLCPVCRAALPEVELRPSCTLREFIELHHTDAVRRRRGEEQQPLPVLPRPPRCSSPPVNIESPPPPPDRPRLSRDSSPDIEISRAPSVGARPRANAMVPGDPAITAPPRRRRGLLEQLWEWRLGP